MRFFFNDWTRSRGFPMEDELRNRFCEKEFPNGRMCKMGPESREQEREMLFLIKT